MATPSFQLYVDKENVGSIGGTTKTKTRNRIGSAPVAKIFGAAGGKPGFATPARKALGDVNRDLKTPGYMATPKQKGLLTGEFKKPDLKVTGPTPIKRQPLSSHPLQQSEQSLKKSLKSQSKPMVFSKPEPRQRLIVEDEIETGFIYQDEEDDFEDIWPKKDRPSSYLNALINWRPSCFGDLEDEEEMDEAKEEEEAAQRRHDIDECIKEIDQLVLNWEPHDDVDFPVEGLLEPELNIDIPLPSLDESLDIYPHMGTLQLKDE